MHIARMHVSTHTRPTACVWRINAAAGSEPVIILSSSTMELHACLITCGSCSRSAAMDHCVMDRMIGSCCDSACCVRNTSAPIVRSMRHTRRKYPAVPSGLVRCRPASNHPTTPACRCRKTSRNMGMCCGSFPYTVTHDVRRSTRHGCCEWTNAVPTAGQRLPRSGWRRAGLTRMQFMSISHMACIRTSSLACCVNSCWHMLITLYINSRSRTLACTSTRVQAFVCMSLFCLFAHLLVLSCFVLFCFVLFVSL